MSGKINLDRDKSKEETNIDWGRNRSREKEGNFQEKVNPQTTKDIEREKEEAETTQKPKD